MGFERKFKPSSTSKIDYDNLSEGEHEARLIYVADCGLQLRDFQGDVKPPAQQIALCFEVLGSTITVDGAEQPRIIWSKPFNIFGRMSGLSTEYGMYKAFVPTAQEETIADWESVLGKPVNIIIKHHKKDADTTYDNVAGVSPIPAKYQDKVEKAVTTNFAIADSEDADSPAIKSLFGLAKFVHDKRLLGNEGDSSEEEAFDDAVFDDAVPF